MQTTRTITSRLRIVANSRHRTQFLVTVSCRFKHHPRDRRPRRQLGRVEIGGAGRSPV